MSERDVSQDDLDCIEAQLGRTPRDVHAIGFRCPCGKPAVVETPPRLGDGTPFPTYFYATCPRLTGAISTLESTGLMGDMNERLATDVELAGAYAAAHEDYLAARAVLKMDVPEVEGISAPHPSLALLYAVRKARPQSSSLSARDFPATEPRSLSATKVVC
jgi:hypothetical protein